MSTSFAGGSPLQFDDAAWLDEPEWTGWPSGVPRMGRLSLRVRLRARLRQARRYGRLGVVASTAVAALIGIVGPVAFATPANAAVLADSALTLDGAPDAAYPPASYQLTLNTQNNPPSFYSRVSVAETENFWWVYEQQPSNIKDATYCSDSKSAPGCYQNWNALVGSDFFAIGFFINANGQQTPVGSDASTVLSVLKNCSAVGLYCVKADAVYAQSPTGQNYHHPDGTYTSGLGPDCSECGLKGFTAGSSAADAATSYDYNWNVVGWQNTSNSPNFVAGSNAPGYIYESAAEFRIPKSSLPAGFTFDPSKASYALHDSPAAPSNSQPSRYVNCSDSVPAQIAVGERATITVDATSDGAPANDALINGHLNDYVGTNVATLDSVTHRTVAPGGTAAFTVTAVSAGTARFHAFWDVNENGARDGATSAAPAEPTTPQTCEVIVSPIPPTQSLEGHIYLCKADGSQGTTEVTGTNGKLETTGPSGPVLNLTGTNPQGPKDVSPTGDYTMTATAPDGYKLVDCQNGFTDTKTVTISAGDHKVINFYVQPLPQDIAGYIYLCDAQGQPTTTKVLGGRLEATGNGVVITKNDQIEPTPVAAGSYAMSVTQVPDGYHLVGCTVNPDATPGQQTVTVPLGGHGVGDFYVAPNVVQTQTITGHIYLCDAQGNTTTTEIFGGKLQASSNSGLVGPVANPLGPTQVPADSYTLSGTKVPDGYEFVKCGTPVAGQDTVVVPAGGSGVGEVYVAPIGQPPTQTIAGHIYLCDSQGQTTVVEVLGGTLTATGAAAIVGPVSNPMPATSVPAGTYTLTGQAPPLYHFVTCGTPTAGQDSVTVPSGGAGVGKVYVSPNVVQTQTVAGHIYLCDAQGQQTTSEVLGGRLQATSPSGTLGPVANPIAPTQVPADTYTLTGTKAPDGYQFVKCGTAVAGQDTVVVPAGGAGVGEVYVAPLGQPPTQTIAGHIYLCDSANQQTTTEILGGMLQATAPAGTVGPTANPLIPTLVPADTYTLSGTKAPDGYHFVTCGTPTAGQDTVVVPSGGAGVGEVYVSPNVVQTQTIAGHIYLCDSLGRQTTTEIGGGMLKATGPATVGPVANPMSPTQVPAATYTLTGTQAPAGYQFVACGTPAAGQDTVVVPAGGAGVGELYAAPIPQPPNQTLAGHIYDCVGNVVTTTLRNGGTIAATGPSTIPVTQNQLAPTSVNAGSYTMTATPPAGYRLVSCGVNPTPNTVSVFVPSGGSGEGKFYAEPIPTITLNVTKTNDADVDAVFHDTETAPAPDASVTFEVTVVNASATAVVIDSITDAYPIVATGGAVTCLVNGTTDVIGTVLAASGQPGSSVTCRFTIDGYAPAAGSSLTDRVTVEGHEQGHPENPGKGQDTSTVLSPGVPETGHPDLAIVKIASANSVSPGDNLTYTLRVSNVGDAATTGDVKVTDAIPGTLDPISASGTDWACTISGQDLTCLWLGAAVQPGVTLPAITVATTVRAGATGTIVNTGIVKTPGDVNPTNDTSTVKTPIVTVLPEKIVKPTTPTVQPSVLPFTGSPANGLLPYAAWMLLIGLLLLIGTVRRPRPRPRAAVAVVRGEHPAVRTEYPDLVPEHLVFETDSRRHRIWTAVTERLRFDPRVSRRVSFFGQRRRGRRASGCLDNLGPALE